MSEADKIAIREHAKAYLAQYGVVPWYPADLNAYIVAMATEVYEAFEMKLDRIVIVAMFLRRSRA